MTSLQSNILFCMQTSDISQGFSISVTLALSETNSVFIALGCTPGKTTEKYARFDQGKQDWVCSDIKQTNIHNKRCHLFTVPKVHALEHVTCKQTVQQHRNNMATFTGNFANKYLNLVLYSLLFQSTIWRDCSLMCSKCQLQPTAVAGHFFRSGLLHSLNTLLSLQIHVFLKKASAFLISNHIYPLDHFKAQIKEMNIQ